MELRKIATSCLLVVAACGSSFAFADEDDATWIAQCVADNKAAAAQVPEVVKKYCKCMNDEMDEGETQSITKWETEHPEETKACVKKATGG